ncbi:MarR family protein [Roseibium hamelinense]|uniref:MarR family protein n=1 Tax=Roseibium hamelinense TaxID=150831 RepID=A0A562SJ13_9HYPH|nr:MarR family transcriptional regulator [Roseibium hamelinense]MTI43909.1 MarR family transcriptional regulator [Roseibium hamelinense]TWI80796.1 MarR family protein [Roseibium hamelinense]
MPVEMRASQALRLLHDVNLSLVRGNDADLSSRQLTILLKVYLEPPPHTVRGLAAELDVTKPAITRALDTLGSLRLLSRKRDEADRRNVIVTRTLDGALYLERLGDLVVEKARALAR